MQIDQEQLLLDKILLGLAAAAGLWFGVDPPSIFIPWTSVESVVETRIPFTRAAVVKIRGQSNTLSLYGAAGSAVARAYGRSH